MTTAPDPSGRFQILTITDLYPIEAWRATMNQLLASPVFLATHAVLVDRRVSTPPTTEFVNQMVDFFGSHVNQLGDARVAIVTSELATFGMGRMTASKADHQNPTLSIHVFRAYDEAVAWIGSEQ